MVSALPSLSLNIAISSFSSTNPRSSLSNYTRRRSPIVTFRVRASSAEKGESNDKNDKPEFNPFGFVTDNPSSRSAIQLPESPAEDGNVGQMLYRIEDKGKEYGSYIKSGKLRWFVRETGSAESRRGTIVFLHGAPTQSFSYRVVMSQLADAGFHCFAPDWIGFGFSDKPQPGYGFDYTEKEFHEGLDKLLEVLGSNLPFFWLYRFIWINLGPEELKQDIKASNTKQPINSLISHSQSISAAKIFSLGIYPQIPLFGEFTCQNAIIAERFIEAGSPYVLKNDKADVYRLPYLSSSGPGFALLEAAKKTNFKGTFGEIATGFAAERWDKPVLLAWGLSDKYLPQSVAEEFQKGNPGQITLKLIEGAGHMPQEDWPEKVVDALRVFF